MKFNPDATQILFSTYFPAAISALAIDAAGNLYVTGFHLLRGLSGDAGPPGGDRHSARVDQCHVRRLSHQDRGLGRPHPLFDAHLRPPEELRRRQQLLPEQPLHRGNAVAVDAAGNAYLAGNTDTADLPTTAGALLAQGTGAFVAKVNAAGTALVYLTYLGPGYQPISPNTNPANIVSGIAADAAGNAYVTGSTFDDAFPATAGAWQTGAEGRDGCIRRQVESAGQRRGVGHLSGRQGRGRRKCDRARCGRQCLAQRDHGSADFPNQTGWSQGGDFLTGSECRGLRPDL